MSTNQNNELLPVIMDAEPAIAPKVLDKLIKELTQSLNHCTILSNKIIILKDILTNKPTRENIVLIRRIMTNTLMQDTLANLLPKLTLHEIRKNESGSNSTHE